MGNRSFVTEIPEKIGTGPIRRGMGRSVEQYYPGGDKDTQAGHHGPEGLPRRGANYEETPTRQANSIVRCVYDGGTDLYHHGIDEERQFTGIFTRYARYGLTPTGPFIAILCYIKKE